MLLAVAEHLSIESPLLPRVATGLCGGMARTTGPCGALTGGVLALGLALGRDDAAGSVEPCYAAVQRLRAAFLQVHGSTACAEIIGLDLGDPAGGERFRAEGLRGRCRGITAETARLTAEILTAR